MAQQKQSIELSVGRKLTFQYLLHLPPGYDPDAGWGWPLILFLHGRGERGNDLERVKQHGLAKKLETWPDCPFIVVSPQCPDSTYWVAEIDALDALLDEILRRYPVDQSRVYLTGLSMGGQGAWYLANARPERFAALAPICGPTLPLLTDRIAAIPTWVFHGTQDQTIPISESERMVTLLKAQGADVQFTIYPGGEHDVWTETYDNPRLYEWLLEHTK